MSLLPKNVEFFEIFGELASIANKSAKLLEKLSQNGNRGLDVKVHKLEHEADELCHYLFQQADKAFVTPIDREDIQLLAKHLDNVIDLIENVISNVGLYGIKNKTSEFKKFSKLILKSTQNTQDLVILLKSKGKNIKEMKKLVIKIHSLENDGDDLIRQSLKKLFNDGKQPLEVIKWKDIYEELEQVLDECEDVADVVETIVVKNF